MDDYATETRTTGSEAYRQYAGLAQAANGHLQTGRQTMAALPYDYDKQRALRVVLDAMSAGIDPANVISAAEAIRSHLTPNAE